MHTIRNHLQTFFDLFYIGEGETGLWMHFLMHTKQTRRAGGSRQDFLLKAAQIPGMYVPSLYEVTYKEDGTIESFQPDIRRMYRKRLKNSS